LHDNEFNTSGKSYTFMVLVNHLHKLRGNKGRNFQSILVE
jgi:hypothetical protein